MVSRASGGVRFSVGAVAGVGSVVVVMMVCSFRRRSVLRWGSSGEVRIRSRSGGQRVRSRRVRTGQEQEGDHIESKERVGGD